MLRTAEEKNERERALKERNEERWEEGFLTLLDCARLMNCSRETARRLFRREPGVEVWRTPGSHKPIIRVPRPVFERVMRRSANPWS